MSVAEFLLLFVQFWGAAGAVVCVLFLFIGIDRVDPAAHDAYAFRPLLIPGILVIWPLVLWRWAVLETGRGDWRMRHAPPRRAHAKVWAVLAWVIPLLLIAALSFKQDWPAGYAPQKIAEPPASGGSQ